MKNPILLAAQLTLAVVSTLGLMSCGSGKGDQTIPETARPKTLDEIILTLDGNVRFEFVRNIGTPPAIQNGDVETGTFFYTLGGQQIRQFPNQRGDTSDTRFPDSISNASYTYQAINETSALLTLRGIGVNDLNTTGSFNAGNLSFTFLFNSDSLRPVPNIINEVEIDLTFNTAGQIVNTGISTVRIPGSALPEFDVIRMNTSVSLLVGGGVPYNYLPIEDPLRPSKIAPESLDKRLLQFTNGIPDPTFDFTVQFISDRTQVGTGTTTEIGQGFLRIAGAPQVDAINYTWERIGGTDAGTLVITRSNTTFDGRYRLNFLGRDNGTYVGEVDADTLDANEVSGRFFIPGNP